MITHILPTPTDVARALIGRILQCSAGYTSDRKMNIALSGGSTPALMFRLWAEEFAEQTPWDHIRFFWVDERCVPPTDPESNYGMTLRNLLARVPVAEENVMRIMGENTPADEARRYEQLVRSLVPAEGGFPAFDIVLLGAGDDGHTSSIFPGQEQLLNTHEAYAVGTHPVSGQQRVALTGLPIIHARHLFFLLTGAAKAPVLADILRGEDEGIEGSDSSLSETPAGKPLEKNFGPAAYVAHRALHNVEIFADEAAKGI